MTLSPNSSQPNPSRFFVWLDWIVVGGLIATVIWTALGLGGYLAETLVVTSWAVFGLTALACIALMFARSEKTARLNLAALLPVPFLLYALVSVCWIAPAKWLAWREWLLWLQMWLVFVLALHFGRGSRQTKTVVVMLALLGVVGVGMAAYQRFNDHSWLMLGRSQAVQFFNRSAGMFGIPNSFAGLLELFIPACLVLLFSRVTSSSVKVICAWLAGLFVFALVLTGSRGGWVSLGLVTMIWPLLTSRNWLRKLAGFGGAVVFIAAGTIALFHFNEDARLRLQPLLEGKMEASRPVMWKVGLEIWQDHPLLGSGAGSYKILFDQYRPRGCWDAPIWTHNDYLNTLSDYGVMGFALWLGAGIWLFWLGWRAVQRARAEKTSTLWNIPFWKWQLGLLLGLLAFSFHLVVDFHTKLPALAFVFALIFGWLLRDEGKLLVNMKWRRLGVPFAAGSLLVASLVAGPLYRSEALRFEARRSIDRYAVSRQGDFRSIVSTAKAGFLRATEIDPNNAQAWADLSYATAQDWQGNTAGLVAVGREAELAAEIALSLCPGSPHFWITKGVALDMQGRQNEGETCFRRALDLAPNLGVMWYYYAYHLQAFPARKTEAVQALDNCLALDPSILAAVTLRQKLIVRP